MRVIEDNFNMSIESPTVVVLGSFDGIHLGHRALLDGASKMAKKIEKQRNVEKVNVMVCTFKNHPLSVVNKEICPRLIMSNDEKTCLFEKLNVDILNYMNFNEEFMKISPSDFVCNLVNCYNAVGVVVGFNYRFGYKNTGDVKLLNEKSNELNFELLVVEPVKSSEEVISSTIIRNYIEDGKIQEAADYLGRPFMISGEVISGRRIGRTMEFPTANLKFGKNHVIPKGGVYGTVVEVFGKKYKGITNIGNNPTVNGKELSIETHILDFNKDIYGEKIKVHFIEKLRDEKKFDSIEKLKEQLESDKDFVDKKDYLNLL